MSRAGDPTKRRLYVDDGRYYELPDWATEEDIAAFKRSHPEIMDDPTLAGAIAEGIKNIPKGVLGTALGMGVGITALLPGDTGAQGAFLNASERLRESSDPRYRDSYIAQFGQGLGSAGAFFGIGALTGGLGAATQLATRGAAALGGAAAAGSLSGVGEHVERRAIAEESGETIGAADALLSTIGGALVGATEAFPLGRLFGAGRKVTEQAVKEGLKQIAKRTVADRINSAALQGLEEGAQEFLAGTAQNAIAKYTYDPEARVMADGRDFTVGFGVGAFMDVAVRAMTGGNKALARIATLRADQALRSGYMPEITESLGRETKDEVDKQIEETGTYVPIQHNYNVVANEDKTAFTIVDETGNRISRDITSTERADDAIEELRRRDVAKASWGSAYLQLRNQGLHLDSYSLNLGVLVHDPYTNHIPLEVVANYLNPDEYGPETDLIPSSRSSFRLAGVEKLKPYVEAGRSFVSFVDAHNLLDKKQMNALLTDLITVGAYEMSQINATHAATIDPETGRPKAGSFKWHDQIATKIGRMAKATSDYLDGTGQSGLSAADLNIKIPELEKMLEDRGWKMPKGGLNSPEGKALKLNLVGTEKLNSPLLRQLFALRIAALPFRTGSPVVLPDFSPTLYTQDKVDKMVSLLNHAGEKMSLTALQDEMDMEIAPFNQMVRHLQRSGAVTKPTNNRNKTVGFVPEVDRVVDKLSDEVNALTGKQAGTQAPSYIEETLTKLRDERARREEITPEEIDKAEGSPREKADFIKGTQAELGALMEKIKEFFRGMGVNTNVEIDQTGEAMTEIMRTTVHALTGGKLPSAALVDPRDDLTTIILNAAHFAEQNPGATTAELFEAIRPTLYYEGYRVLVNSDMLTQEQKEGIDLMINKEIIPDDFEGGGLTFQDWAREKLAKETEGTEAPFDPEAAGSREAVREMAGARMFEEFAEDNWRPTSLGRSTDNVLKKMFNAYRDMVGLGVKPETVAALSLFNNLKSGMFGSRIEQEGGEGMSATTPEGPVRTPLYLDREITENPSPIPWVPTEAEQRALDDSKDTNPAPAKVGDFASPEAINVYYNSRNESDEASPNVRFRYGRSNNLADPGKFLGEIPGAVKYDPDDRTKYETMKDAVQHGDFEKNPKVWFDRYWKRFRQAVMDRRQDVERLDKQYRAREIKNGALWGDMYADMSTIAAFRFRDASMHYVKSAITRGAMIYTGTDALRGYYKMEVFKDKNGNEYAGLIEVFKLLDNPITGKNDEVIADEYLTARRVIYHHAINHSAKDRTPGGRTLADAKTIVSRIEADPEAKNVVQFGDAMVAWNDTLLDLAESTEVISKELADEWRGNTYVPFHRMKQHEQDEHTKAQSQLRARTARKKGDVRSFRKVMMEMELEGDNDQLDIDLISRVVSNAESVIQDAMINVAYRRVARDLLALGEATDVDADGKPYATSEPNAIRYMENGEERIVVAKDPFLMQAVVATSENFMGVFERWLAATPAMILRESVTRNPAFVVRNLIRDTLSASITSGSNFVPFADTLAKFNRKDYELAEKLGIALEHDFINDPTRYRNQMMRLMRERTGTKSQFLKLWDKLGELSRMSDAATRMAVYEDVLERTGNEAEAIYQAYEIINFGRRGNNAAFRMLSSSIPFLNARIQGLDVLGRAAFGHYTANPDLRDPGAIQKQFLLRGMFLGMATGVYYAAVSDKDWYLNQRDEVKDDFWLIPVGGGVIATVPVPFEVGLLFKTIPEQMMRLVMEEGYSKERAAEGAMRGFMKSANFRPIPQILSPYFDVANNRSSYSGEPIVPSFMDETLPEEDQRDLNTNEAVAMLGEVLDISPMKLDYLINGYLGPLAGFVTIVADKLARQEFARDVVEGVIPWVELTDVPTANAGGTRQDIVNPFTDFRSAVRSAPVLRQLFRDAGAGGGYQQQFYRLRAQVDSAVAKVNKAQRENRFEDMVAARHEEAALFNVRGTVRTLDKFMTNWRRRRDRVLMSDDAPSKKRERIHDLEAERDRALDIVPFLLETIKQAE